MNPVTRSISRNAVRGLLDELAAEDCAVTVCVSAETLGARDYGHLLPESEPERSQVAEALAEGGSSDTGVAVFAAPERVVAVQPPFPLTVDVRAAGLESKPILEVFNSEPVVGIVLLRLGRYAIAVLRGNKLLATKTDTRYVKNRHRKGGSSQRRFERSRERLVREFYDTTCRMTRTVFEPHLRDIDYVMLGGERGTLNGFVKRCRMMRDLESKTLSRILPVDRPNQKALESISYEVWKSRVTFW
ncbi:MAG: hypothetical protein J4G14_12345 [Dehalococcoidia bacterium]|nr:hypothetical protein [Dehalococcoidia bacterium]